MNAVRSDLLINIPVAKRKSLDRSWIQATIIWNITDNDKN